MNTILDISLLNSCNFHCDYCISNSTKAKKQPFGNGRYEMHGVIIDPDIIIDFINKHFSNAIVQLSGGEPLTYIALPYIIDNIKNENVIINTNGALIKNVKKLHYSNIKWRISVHPDYRSVDSLLSDIEPLLNNNQYIYINYVVHPRHIVNDAEYALDIISKLEQTNIPFEVTPFVGLYENKSYSIFSELYDGLITPRPKIPSYNLTTIQADGRIYPCHSYSNGTNSIGNIYTNEYEYKDCLKCISPDGTSLCQTMSSIYNILNLYDDSLKL